MGTSGQRGVEYVEHPRNRPVSGPSSHSHIASHARKTQDICFIQSHRNAMHVVFIKAQNFTLFAPTRQLYRQAASP